MADLTGVEWQGEPLAYGTIVSAPSRGIVAMVLTGREGAMVCGWHALRPGEHAILMLGARFSEAGNFRWMLDYESETLRWFVR